MFPFVSRKPRPPLPPAESPARNGFTLVEMLVALTIFGLGVMALASTLPQGLSVRDKARRMTVATSYAQETVERLRDLRFDDAALAAGDHTHPDSPLDGAYRTRWSVQDGVPVPDMKRIVVTVSFPTSSADSIATMTTQIYRGSQ